MCIYGLLLVAREDRLRKLMIIASTAFIAACSGGEGGGSGGESTGGGGSGTVIPEPEGNDDLVELSSVQRPTERCFKQLPWIMHTPTSVLAPMECSCQPSNRFRRPTGHIC